MKKCCRCKQEKSTTDFNKSATRKDGLQSFCRECSRAKYKEHYSNNKTAERERLKITKTKYVVRAQEYVYNYLLNNHCIDCGMTNVLCLEFDHLSDKEHNISTMIREGMNPKRIQSEIDKCVVRCANCHRIKTAHQFNWYKLKV